MIVVLLHVRPEVRDCKLGFLRVRSIRRNLGAVGCWWIVYICFCTCEYRDLLFNNEAIHAQIIFVAYAAEICSTQINITHNLELPMILL